MVHEHARQPEADRAKHVAARTFAAGAGFGFLAGAFVVSAAVWQFGNFVGSRADRSQSTAQPPPAVSRWEDGIDDAGGIIESVGHPTAPTSGTSPAAPGSAPPPARRDETATIGPALESPRELAERDLEIPVEGVQPEQLTRQFSDSRGGRLHQAIDILAPRNTPVKAVEDGTIARLFYSKAGGITIYQFDPSEQYCYYYAHLERYADGLREGERVRKGQVIGYVGTSGNAPKETPHLHFAVFRLTEQKRWWEGTPIDPYDILR